MARRLDPKRVIKGVTKRSTEIVELDPQKIYDALFAACEHIAVLEEKQVDKQKINELTDFVLEKIARKGVEYPHVDYINQIDAEILRENGLVKEANHFQRYAQQREELRKKLLVTKLVGEKGDSTDKSLLVEGEANYSLSQWNRQRIEYALMKECGLDKDKARMVAKQTEKTIGDLGLERITTDLVREVVNIHLLTSGEEKRMKKQQILGMPTHDLEQLIFSKSKENSNIAANNPEAVNLAIAETILKKYGIENVFSKDVTDAHLSGRFHLHDLGYPIRTYCSSHSLEYLKKFGLDLENLTIKSTSPSHSRTLTGHLNTYLASMQAYYAGALGVGYMNIMYAPLIKADIEGMNEKEKKEFMKQEAQYMLFTLSQSAFSRGGQVLFIDANIHTGVPKIMEDTPAIGPKGCYMIKRKKTLDDVVGLTEDELKNAEIITAKQEDNGEKYYLAKLENKIVYLGSIPEKKKNNLLFISKKELLNRDGKIHFIREYDDIELVKEIKRDEKGNAINPEDGIVLTYKDFKKETQDFARAMLDVWREGDAYGKVFSFPKCDLHVNDDSFNDPSEREIFDYACRVASENGSPYFFFDRNASQLSQCCRLRTTISDPCMIKYPERMRFCGFQNITINLPQAAYRVGKGNLDGLIKDIQESMELAAKAHIQKKDFVKDIMDSPGTPLWQVGKKAADGQPYVDLNKATYIIGLIGLNEAIQYITGKELHEGLKESEDGGEAYQDGMVLISAMNQKSDELTKKYGLKFTLEESPAESASRRFIKTDLKLYHEQTKSVMKGDIDSDEMYYTNSIHFRADAPISLTDRIEYQSRFHNLIESGAIIHAFVGEHRPSAESIANLVEKTYKNTQCAQLVISPEFTYCNDCHQNYAGLREKCECGSTNVEGITRIVGYYSKVSEWNKSKKGELKDRQKAVKEYAKI